MDDSPWMPPGADANAPGQPLQPPQPPPPPPGAGAAAADPSLPTLPPPATVVPPAPPAPPAPPSGAPFAAHESVPPGFDAAAPVVPALEPTGQRKRSKVLVGGAVVGVLAVGAAGVFAFQGMSSEAKGGASTPDELGTAFMTAIENEDALGIIDLLSPGERDVLRQPAIDFVSELARLGVLLDGTDLATVDYLDAVLERETVEVEGTNVDDIVNIHMTADATVTVDGAKLPIGDLITDNMDPADVDDMRTDETDDSPLDVRLTAVQDDGRWYFSLFHTAAEDLRDDQDPMPDIPLEGIGAKGADSPEAAMNQLLDSVEQLDLQLLIQTLNPGEAAALQRYAPLFLADAQAALDEVPLEWKITTRDFRVDGTGAQRTVLVDGLGIEGTIDGESFSVTADGDCFTAEFGGETIDQCASDVTSDDQLDNLLADAPDVRAFVDALREAFSDIEPIGLELRQTDGAWYVSPVSTLTEGMLAFLRALDRQEIDQLIELGKAAAADAGDLVFGGIDEVLGGGLGTGGFDDGSFGDGSFDDGSTDPFGTLPTTVPGADPSESATESATASETFDDTFDDTSDSAAAGWESCYNETDVAAATSCFQQYVTSGDIEEFMMPIELRFPECGLESKWTRELYSMSDADFIATLEASAPCFQALVDDGTISDFEVPSEVFSLDCYEGRNWYNTFDDPEYDDRYWACVDALYAGDPVPSSTDTATAPPVTTGA